MIKGYESIPFGQSVEEENEETIFGYFYEKILELAILIQKIFSI